MASSNRQPKWDIYEAVILLDGYLETLRANRPKTQIVKHISADLRRMAVNRGIEIDNIYRNENGISYQIQSMDSAYKGKKVYVPATRLFKGTVELYRTDTKRYFKILEEAKSMVAAKQNNKDAFLAWAASTLSAHRYKWIEKNILKMEQLAVASELISGSIFDVTDLATLQTIYKTAEKNIIFRIKNRKFFKSINDDFKIYIQYCSQLSKKVNQVTNTEASDIFANTKLQSTIGSSMEQVTGTTAYKDFVSANASKSDFCEAEFFDYLQNTAKLSTNTCASYVSSIRSAERYAVDHGHVSCSLFSKDKETIIATATELYSEPDFIKYNEHQHNRFSAAINKLLESIGAKIPEKAIAPHGDNCNRQSIASAEVNSKIIAVLKKHYEYGFKYDSIRELMRFRQFADDMGVALPEKDEELKTSIRSSGIVIAGKVYCNSDDMSKELQCIVDNVFFSGAGVIYYETYLKMSKSGWSLM